MLARAQRKGLLRVECIDIRSFATDKHRTVDDRPYGGGPGMVLKPEPVVAAMRAARARDPFTRVVLLSPEGRAFSQSIARRYAERASLTLVCGRYEGFDARVAPYADEVLSVGDFVLSGGEPAALVVLDAVARLLPGVLGCNASAEQDSFAHGKMLDWPQFTRPEVFEGRPVPPVLLSGDHARIERWRVQQAQRRTWGRKR